MRGRSTAILLCITITGLGAACGTLGPSSGSDTDLNAIVVNPDGGDPHTTGQLLVTLPQALDRPLTESLTDLPKPLTISGLPLTIGQPVTLGSGSHDLMHKFGYAYATDNVQINSGAVTTYKLGVVEFSPVPKEATVGFQVWNTPIESVNQTLQQTSLPYQADSHTVAARLPGTYRFAFGLWDGAIANVAGGEVTSVDITSNTNRRSVRVIAPSRTYPGSCSGTPGLEMFNIGAVRGTTARSASELNLESQQSMLIRELEGPGDSPGTYELMLTMNNVLYDRATISMGATGAAPALFEIQRIEVNDVAVHKPDGSVQLEAGTYIIEKQVRDPNGTLSYVKLPCSSRSNPTRTGLDVFPGTYRVTTTYSTIHAGPKQDVQIVTAP